MNIDHYHAAPVWLGYSGTKLQQPLPRPAVIVDLDQSLLNNEHRLHFMQGEKRWAQFFDAMRHDTLYPEVKLIVDLVFKHTEIAVLLVTGRPSQYHGMTLQSLHDLEVPFTALIMRAQHDNRADRDVKLDILKGIRAMGFAPMFAIDDRPEVVHMWRQQGVRTLQCDPSSWKTEEMTQPFADAAALRDENQRLKERVQELESSVRPRNMAFQVCIRRPSAQDCDACGHVGTGPCPRVIIGGCEYCREKKIACIGRCAGV